MTNLLTTITTGITRITKGISIILTKRITPIPITIQTHITSPTTGRIHTVGMDPMNGIANSGRMAGKKR